jgi:hypothetical protein
MVIDMSEDPEGRLWILSNSHLHRDNENHESLNDTYFRQALREPLPEIFASGEFRRNIYLTVKESLRVPCFKEPAAQRLLLKI